MGLRDFIDIFHSWLVWPGGEGMLRIPPLAEAVWQLDRILIAALVLVCLWMLARRQVSYLFVIAALALSSELKGDVLPWSLIAPQIGRAPGDDTIVFLVLGGLVALMALLLLVPRFRSRDRLIITVLGGAVFSTSLLFHLLILHGMMSQGLDAQTNRLHGLAAAREVIGDDHVFTAVCAKASVSCRFGTPDEVLTGHDQFLTTFVRGSLDNRPPGVERMQFGFYNGAGTTDESAAPYAFVWHDLPERPGEGLLIVDSYTVIPLHAAGSMVMFSLMLAAHTTWITLASLIIVVHNRRLHRRSRGLRAELRQLAKLGRAARARLGRRPAADLPAIPAE